MEREREGIRQVDCQLDDLDQVILECESEATGSKIDDLRKSVRSVREVEEEEEEEDDEEEEEDTITVKYLPISIMSIEEKIKKRVSRDENYATCPPQKSTASNSDPTKKLDILCCNQSSSSSSEPQPQSLSSERQLTHSSKQQSSTSCRVQSEEVQVRLVEHIKKNYTLFKTDREIYEYQPVTSPNHQHNKGHLQSLLVQKQSPLPPRAPVSQTINKSLNDQYTQYRASDLNSLTYQRYQQQQSLPKHQTVLLENLVKRSHNRSSTGAKTRSLQVKQATSHTLATSTKTPAKSSLRRSVSSLNDLLKKPLDIVKLRAKHSNQQVEIQSQLENRIKESEQESQYKVPVLKQSHYCYQNLYLNPVPDHKVHIATRSVVDIVSAYHKANQLKILEKNISQPTHSTPQRKLIQLFGKHSFRRSSRKFRESSQKQQQLDQLLLKSEQLDLARYYSNLTELSNTISNIRAKIKMPSGKSDKATIVDSKDGTIKISYEPKEVGQHELSVRFNDENIDETPVVFYVDAIGNAKKKITAYGSGLSHGLVGDLCKFTINTGGLGSSKLSVAIEGPSKTQVNLTDNKDGTITVSYTPQSAGEYKIKVSFDGKQIVGSPYKTMIGDEGRQRSLLNVGRGSEHTLDLKMSQEDLKTLSAVLVSPCGLEEPCPLKLLENGQLAITFTPREQGEHVVKVTRRGNHIKGSPFKFEVLSRDIGDAKQIKVSGKGLKDGKTNADNEILINTREAGYGGLSVSLEGPGRSEISSKEANDGNIKLSYRVNEPGQYSLSVKYADHTVPGSPFTIKVTGQGTNPQKESVRKYRRLAEVIDVNTECHFSFKQPGVSAYDLSARIHSPQGNSEDVSIKDKGEYVYHVTFVPKEVGLHSLSIRNKDIHIPGSPFPITVGPLLDFGAHKIRCGGPGLLRGSCGKVNEFDIFTRDAGAGDLIVMVEGPSKPELIYTDRKDGSCGIGYKVAEPGEYRITVLFNDQEVPDSPFRAFIMPLKGDVAKIELGPMPPENMIQLNKPCNMTVIMNGAKGDIKGKVMLPSGKFEDCFASPIDAENWGVRFIPRELGIHQVHIKFNKESSHIPQSPIFIRVGHDKADPALVLAHGNGLKNAVVNHATDFLVETCNAGHALLDVNIEGPSKVSMSCAEVDEGYKIDYTPLAPGDYIISIKYNGCHIGSSPFKVRAIRQPGSRTVADVGCREVSSVSVSTSDREAKQKVENMPKFKSDATRVYCKGMGLKKAFAGKPNTLTVNCSEAGFNMIYASFLGATRNTIHECSVKHMGGSIYEVKYICKDRGDAILVVKYGDEQIPGSPFRLECV